MHRLGVGIQQHFVAIEGMQFERPVGTWTVDAIGVVSSPPHFWLGDPAVPDASRLVQQVVQRPLDDRLQHVARMEQQQRDGGGMLRIQREIERVLFRNPRRTQRKGRAFHSEPIVSLADAHGTSLCGGRNECDGQDHSAASAPTADA